jgi:hypothetical protein
MNRREQAITIASRISAEQFPSYEVPLILDIVQATLDALETAPASEGGEQGAPYLIEMQPVRKYNPKFGDLRLCVCGHPYDRHFDSYDNMEPVGCKYCDCNDFSEAPPTLATPPAEKGEG